MSLPGTASASAQAPAPILYLASQSPRRLELLAQLGWRPDLLLPGPDEDAEALEATRVGELPPAYVQRVTAAKCAAAVQRHAARQLAPGWILCADTTVALDDEVLGKPADAAQALAMLTRLGGRRHSVYTAVTVHAPDGRQAQALSHSQVWVAPLVPDALRAYVATGEPFGKAGAYGIQGRFAAWVSRIDGSYSGIMGLPLHETARLLHELGCAAGSSALTKKTDP